tara:strand:+ start:14422 stop:20340 length:5919 start_codon:yes stop_codon:yes gene_type:complete
MKEANFHTDRIMTDATTIGSDEARTRVSMSIDSVKKTTFAAAQNAVPILNRVAIQNNGDTPYKNLRLTMQPQPAFCKAKEWVIDRIPALDEIDITDKQVTLDFSVLDRLNEAEHGQLTFTLFDGEEMLIEQVVPIELLARDEWGGSTEMSQILAAFVSPNHSQVSHILKEASWLLEKSGHNSALDGYVSRDPRRAYMLSAAIWSAISGMGLSYAQPPSSFEKQGQKIRDPGCIASTGLATCLDSSLLLAAAFEAIKLNPVVIFTRGHAFVGVWLVDKTFPMTVERDVTEVRKAVSSREFLVLESTLLTHRPTVGFENAKANAQDQLSDDRDNEFVMAIDVARARAAGIRPISNQQVSTVEADDSDYAVKPAALPKLPSFEMIPSEFAEELSATPSDRLDRWQKKLLDLSLRNRLLNFSDSTKQTLRLVCADVPSLEDALADGKKFRVVSLKDENPIGNRDPKLYKQQTGRDIQEEFANTAFTKGQVCADESGKEMKSRLTTLYRKAKSDLAEGGTNTLFMAVGFLRWKKDEKDPRAYKAPLLLLPIKLTRRSAKSSYYISHHEDDVVFNQTLLEYLEQEFGLAIPSLRGELPTDQSGLDIQLIFEMMRQAVRDVPGFEVIENIAVSTFSFAKYLMWKDLVDRTDSLKNNRLVRHLLENPTEVFSDGSGEFPTPDSIDQKVDPSSLYTPLPADSSQLAAVVAAESGKDFVIIGPPGTGKSQTIANVIAHCLAHGKTVLFVAEKSAALDVVYRRLKAYGLADACLELHSNKTDRKSVISQLGAAWDRSSRADEQEWLRLTNDLKIQRDELNLYVSELHRPGSHGYSVYEGIGILSANSPRFELNFRGVESHDQESFSSLIELVERLSITHTAVENCSSLHGIQKTEWSFEWQKKLLKSVSEFHDETVALLASCNQLKENLLISECPECPGKHLSALLGLAKSICKTASGDFGFALSTDLSSYAQCIDLLEKQIGEYKQAKQIIQAEYEDDEVLRIPLEDLDRDWRSESAKIWPMSALGKRRIQRILQSYASSGVANPEVDLAELRKIKRVLESVEKSILSSIPGFEGVQSNVAQLRDLVLVALEFNESISTLKSTISISSNIETELKRILDPGSDSLAAVSSAKELREAKRRFDQAGRSYVSLTESNLEVLTLQSLIDELKGIAAQSDGLNNWVKWVKVRNEASLRGLDPLIEALESGSLLDAKSEFMSAYFSWWLPLAIDQRPKLRSFAHWEQDNQIETFRELIESVQELAAIQVRRSVSHNLPARDGVPRKSELGMLRHQLGLQRPSQSIRGLIEGMPDVFTKLTPCVLMSPLSVAQYLPSEQATFDIVIFDEASQITTWDAVGAIARGRQSIIVGDPKQLPPTNFFGRTNDEEEEELAAHERDLASILDEASAAGLPLHQLNWHYRSRDEDLIAFSNYHYYDQRLVTFPSPTTDSKAVQFHKVDGIYARGSGRTNEVEAKRVVQYLIARLEKWVQLPEEDRLSIGVITFNAPQQELILDLLDLERSKRPELEWFFSDDREEPVIVKNLENIQGDERDVMIFSITFGKDLAGKLPMDFGAVNKQGGEKRLNVAVTRAKSEFHIFSSISAEEIDPSRAKGLGVQHLKNYLDYAQRGAVALPAMDEGSLGPAENMFEASVAEALRSRGWEVRTQIGVSGFRIDLGVVHPDHAGAFLAGVECDGATYHSSATARDRDQIREGVLRHLGWEILRVWSTEWFMHPQPALQRLDESLNELLELSRAEQKDEPDLQDSESDTDFDEETNRHQESSIDPESSLNETELELDLDECTDSQELPQYAAPSSGAIETGTTLNAELLDEFPIDPERFFEWNYTQTLKSVVSRVVSEQGPISESMLYRAIAKIHGWQRAGKRIQTRVHDCLGDNEQHEENGNVFIWAAGTYAESIAFRPHIERTSRDIPRAEIFGLIKEQPHILNAPDQAKELANLIGLGRLSEDTRKYLDLCLSEFEDKDLADE